MTIVDALRDPRLLGALPQFRDLTTWAAWIAFAKAVYGLPLTAAELDTFRRHTGRRHPRPGGYPEAVCIVGVQSGKSATAAALADHAALTGPPGTHALLLGQDHRGAMRTLLKYARQPFEDVDVFRNEVVRATADSLDLKNGVSLSAYPCRPAAVRGIRACIVIIDELAFFTATDGRPADVEMLRVARGRTATTGGKTIVLSSPYAQTGALCELHRKHFGREDSPTLIWQASAPDMNPTLPTDYIERMRADDPEAYRSEVLGEFRTGLSTLLDIDALDACIAHGIRERAPEAGRRYVAGADPASGSGKDSFTVAVSHSDGDRAVLDVCRAWAPAFNPSGVIAEAADLIKSYGLREIVGDRYAPGFVLEAFRSHGIGYKFSDKDRSALYLDLVPLVNSGRVVLLDDPKLLAELRGLERRRGTSGRDKADHRPGLHDDRATSAAVALGLASGRAPRHAKMFNVMTGKPLSMRPRDPRLRLLGPPSGDPVEWQDDL